MRRRCWCGRWAALGAAPRWLATACLRPQPNKHTLSPQTDAQRGVRGYDKVEEHDPTERMRRMQRSAEQQAAAAAAGRGGEPSAPAPGPPRKRVPSLEEELARLHTQVDLRDFEYVPVPRTEGEGE